MESVNTVIPLWEQQKLSSITWAASSIFGELRNCFLSEDKRWLSKLVVLPQSQHPHLSIMANYYIQTVLDGRFLSFEYLPPSRPPESKIVAGTKKAEVGYVSHCTYEAPSWYEVIHSSISSRTKTGPILLMQPWTSAAVWSVTAQEHRTGTFVLGQPTMHSRKPRTPMFGGNWTENPTASKKLTLTMHGPLLQRVPILR